MIEKFLNYSKILKKNPFISRKIFHVVSALRTNAGVIYNCKKGCVKIIILRFNLNLMSVVRILQNSEETLIILYNSRNCGGQLSKAYFISTIYLHFFIDSS